jgi:hypothetical protein
MKDLMRTFLFSFLFFFLSWLVLYKLNVNSLPLQSEDALPSIFTGIVIVKEGTINLDSFYQMMVSKYPQPDDSNLTPFYLRKVNNHYLSAFPIMNTILSLPVFLLYVPFITTISWDDVYLLSHLSGSFILSISCVALFYLFNRVLKSSTRNSYLLTAIYALATINLPLISQALWQHGAVQFFSIVALIFFLRERYLLTFMFLGFGILSRPTAGIVLAALFLFLLLSRKLNIKVVISSAIGILIPVLFFFSYNYVYYTDLSNQGYASQLGNSWLGNFPESFIGIWVSPSKGLLIYSPIFIITLIGIWKGYRKDSLVTISFWIILIHTLVLSKWKHWYGGYGYGYRMISDIIPFFIIPIWYLLENYYEKVKKGVFLTFSVSFIIQISGLVFFDSIWHNAYDTGFKNTSWLWSIKDSEAAFNARRVMVKLNLLDRACEKCLPQNR